MQFDSDEAIQLLRSCAVLTAEPHLFLRDMLGGTAPKMPRIERGTSSARPVGWFDRVCAWAEAVARFRKNSYAWLSDTWNRPVCRFAEGVTSAAYRLWLVGGLCGQVCTLLLILCFRPYRPRLRPFLISRMPRLRSLFFHSMDEETKRFTEESTRSVLQATPNRYGRLAVASFESAIPGHTSWLDTASKEWKSSIFHLDTMQSMAALAAVVVYAVLYPIDKLFGLPAWLSAVMTRFAILTGARAAAGGAPGMDMLGAAFDPTRTGHVPDRVSAVTIPHAIEQDVEQRLAARSRIDVTTLRASIDPARRATLLKAIETAFTDVGLLHAQYYQDERIVDYVAQCIAGNAEPEWVHEQEALGAWFPARRTCRTEKDP